MSSIRVGMILVVALCINLIVNIAIAQPATSNDGLPPVQEAGVKNPDYPKKSITIMAPASPGGGWDQLARLMQQSLISEKISPVPVEVVNRGGAGGTIGLTELITQHRRDSYTWMVGGSTLVSAMLMHDTRFNLSEAELLARLASPRPAAVADAVPAGRRRSWQR